jgi:hypothetical protein
MLQKLTLHLSSGNEAPNLVVGPVEQAFLSLKNKTWTIPQTRNHKKSHELRFIRPLTPHKRAEHMYLKFITPLTLSVEKTVNLFHGFK